MVHRLLCSSLPSFPIALVSDQVAKRLFTAMSTVESNNADGSGDSAAKLAGSNGGEESVANQNGDALEAAPVLSNDEAAIDAALAAAVAGEENVDPNVAKSAHPLGEEVWGLKMVLPAPQINAEHPTRCSGDGCNLVACTIWSSNHDPETPWYSCLDCQEEDFGGWPTAESGNLPLKAVSDSLLEAMTNKCTMKEDPNFPNLPPVIEIEASQVGLSYELESNGDSDDRTKAVEFGTKVVYAVSFLFLLHLIMICLLLTHIRTILYGRS